MNKKVLIIIGVLLLAIGLFIYLKVPVDEFIGPSYSQEPFKGPANGSDKIERDGIFHSLAISPTNPDIVYIGTETNGIFKSVDGGENWQWLRNGLWHDNRGYSEAYDMLVDPDDENIVYVVMTNGPQPPEIEKAAGFYISFDGGENWERRINGLPNTGANSVAKLDQTLFIGIDGEESSNHLVKKQVEGGIYKSDDQGENWAKVNLPDKGTQNKYTEIYVREGLLYTSGKKWKGEGSQGSPRMIDSENAISIIKSSDKGESWESINPEPDSFCWYFDVSKDGQTIYLTDGKNHKTYASNNGGDSWEISSSHFGNQIRISPFDKKMAIFASGNQLSKTIDGLNSNKMVFQVEGDHGFDDIEFTSDENIIYAAGDGYRVYKSLDSGDSWEQIANLREYINQQ